MKVTIELDELDVLTRASIARQTTDKEVLEVLSKDKWKDVRYEVAGNPNTPGVVLSILAHDKFSDVRLNVAKNPNTPRDTLSILSTDNDVFVSTYALKIIKH